MMKRNALKLIAACALSMLATGVFTACSEAPPAFVSVDVTGAEYAKGFTLTDHNGQVRQLSDFKGKVVVLFFGYTQCPDVCPTSMAELAEVKKALGKDGERLQGLFVTVDPERDTPQVLKGYMANFDPSFLALRPTPAEMEQMAKDYKVYFKKAEGKTATSYTMDHSAGSYVYDTKGQLRLFTRYGSGAPALAADIQILLKQAS